MSVISEENGSSSDLSAATINKAKAVQVWLRTVETVELRHRLIDAAWETEIMSR